MTDNTPCTYGCLAVLASFEQVQQTEAIDKGMLSPASKTRLKHETGHEVPNPAKLATSTNTQ